MNIMDQLKEIGAYAKHQGINWEIKITPEKVTLAVAPLGPDWEGDRPVWSWGTHYQDMQAVVNRLDFLAHEVAQLPLPGWLDYQVEQKEGTEFCGLNSYLGQWVFPNGWGLSLCRKNHVTPGSIDFDLMLFYGYNKADKWGHVSPNWLDDGEYPEGVYHTRYNREELEGIAQLVFYLEPRTGGAK